MTSPQRRFPVYSLSSAVASVVVVERESALAVDAVVQAGAVGASLVPGDVVGKAAAEVVVATDAEVVAPTTSADESVGGSEEAVVEDVMQAPRKDADARFEEDLTVVLGASVLHLFCHFECFLKNKLI